MKKLECENETEYYKAQEEYSEMRRLRDIAVSENRSRRMRGVRLLTVPELPELPLIPIAYKGKQWEGRLHNIEECPNGCTVKWQKAKW